MADAVRERAPRADPPRADPPRADPPRAALWSGLKARRGLLWAVGTGAFVSVAAAVFLAPVFAATTRALIAWDAALAAYLAVLAVRLRGSSVDDIKERARDLDAGAFAVLGLTTLAAAACLAAILFEVAAAKAAPGGATGDGAGRLALAGLTVVLSWTATHVAFAMHYAHEYFGYGADRHRGGLVFPSDEAKGEAGEPRGYGDFLYVAFVIGVAAQTADVGASSAAMRQVMLWHGLVAFVFNTAIVALCINVAAGLLG